MQNIEEIVKVWKSRIDHFILSQPEQFTPLQQCERISMIVDGMVEEIVSNIPDGTCYCDMEKAIKSEVCKKCGGAVLC